MYKWTPADLKVFDRVRALNDIAAGCGSHWPTRRVRQSTLIGADRDLLAATVAAHPHVDRVSVDEMLPASAGAAVVAGQHGRDRTEDVGGGARAASVAKPITDATLKAPKPIVRPLNRASPRADGRPYVAAAIRAARTPR